jgi:hypothetical protein
MIPIASATGPNVHPAIRVIERPVDLSFGQLVQTRPSVNHLRSPCTLFPCGTYIGKMKALSVNIYYMIRTICNQKASIERCICRSTYLVMIWNIRWWFHWHWSYVSNIWWFQWPVRTPRIWKLVEVQMSYLKFADSKVKLHESCGGCVVGACKGLCAIRLTLMYSPSAIDKKVVVRYSLCPRI